MQCFNPFIVAPKAQNSNWHFTESFISLWVYLLNNFYVGISYLKNTHLNKS